MAAKFRKVCPKGHDLNITRVKTKESTRCGECLKEKARRSWQKSGREVKYGLAEGQFTEILEAQNYRCPLCNNDLRDRLKHLGNGRGKYPQVDHDHKTGQIRGILCPKCNTALGFFNDDADLLQRATDYVIKGGNLCQVV